MAEIPGGPHSHECATATSEVCVCACRGVLHGVAVHGGPPALLRMADVTVTGHRDSTPGATAVHVDTAAGRRAHPVIVTHTSGGPVLLADLAGLGDDDLMRHFTDASAGGHEHVAQRLWDEMGRRERETPPTYRLPGPVHTLTDEQLGQAAHDASGDTAILHQVYAEMDRRDRLAEQQAHEAEHQAELRKPFPTHWQDADTPEDRKVDELVGRGWSYLDAYAEAHNLDPTRLHAQQHAGTVDRAAGEHIDRAVRRQYDQHVHLAYVAAETATRGHMLSAAGRAAGIDPLSLFSGPTDRARKYASEDLLRWWADNGGRQTFTQFRAQVLGRAADKVAGRKTAMAGQGRDFG